MRFQRICFVFLCAVLTYSLLFSAAKIVPVSMTSPFDPAITLILDAGHGGEDGGAYTSGGAKESDINLSIVLKLNELLAFCGVEAFLIRDSDRSLHSETCRSIREKKISDLKNRVEQINSLTNPILISVHQNHFTDPRCKGAQVFYGIGDISRYWGEHTQEVLRQTLSSQNSRKAKLISDSVYLFQNISCPSILVECGFLSNGEEASLLLTEHYQRKVSLALTVACLNQIEAMNNHLGGQQNGKNQNNVLLH